MRTSPDAPLEVRPAVPADEPAIRHLLEHTLNPSLYSWPWREHLGQETFQVALICGRPVGALLAFLDAGPVAWVQLAALASGVGVGPWLDRILPPLVRPLRRLGGRVLAWMDVDGWVGPALQARGFWPLSRLVTMVKQNRYLPAVEAAGVELRRAEAADLPRLVRLDHAAFSPPWWFSVEALDRLRRESLCFWVAEQEGRCLGYVEARLVEYGAHIGRLAVAPRAQGQRIGGALLAEALAQVWAQGVERVTLNTQEGNRASQRLYDHFGFYLLGRRVVAWGRWL